jgi:molybdopterin molybdotransferase
MTDLSDTLQRIKSLTPVAEILSRLDTLVQPVATQDVALNVATGAALAADIVAPVDVPLHSSALHDGWAVGSEAVIDASPYSPTTLSSLPVWVDAGQPMPAGTDAILPADALAAANENVEVHASVAQGEGVLPARFDAAKDTILFRAGKRLRTIDVAVLRALAVGIIRIRAPRVTIISASSHQIETDTVAPVIADAVRARSGIPEIARPTELEAILSKPGTDAIVTIGGTGAGNNDKAVKLLERLGNVEFHGFGISPGQTAALGNVNGCPVLMLPGRLDAALAAFFVVGSRLMARLTGSKEENETVLPISLTRKVTSTIGFADIVFVRHVAGGIEPLGSNTFPLQALIQADGWILIPSGSEGVAAGTKVEMRSLL